MARTSMALGRLDLGLQREPYSFPEFDEISTLSFLLSEIALCKAFSVFFHSVRVLAPVYVYVYVFHRAVTALCNKLWKPGRATKTLQMKNKKYFCTKV